MTDPQVIISNGHGVHNDDLEATRERLRRGKGYRDLSTIIVIPTRGQIPARVVECWMGLMTPMNQPIVRMFVENMEVGDAYNVAIETILEHSVLKDWKYVLTLEEDNMPPPDGLLKLYEHIDDYSVVGGLYFTKGEGGQPMIYGKPGKLPFFAPQIPEPNTIQEANGLGMGFNLWRLDVFRDPRFKKPWFKTLQEWSPDKGGKGYSQDLYAYEQLRNAGHRVACDTRVKVGHIEVATGIIW